MGYERVIFINSPDNSLECAICQEIICDPVSGVNCGHSFCITCMKKWTAEQARCPTCRKKLSQTGGSDDDDDDESESDSDEDSSCSGDSQASTRTTPVGTFRNIALSRLIDNLQVSCSNKKECATSDHLVGDTPADSNGNSTSISPRSADCTVARLPTGPAKGCSTNSPRALSTEDNNSVAASTATTTTTTTRAEGLSIASTETNSTDNYISCKWTGSLADYKNKHVDECPFEKVTCFVPGCDFKCLRCELDGHLTSSGVALVSHVKFLIEQQTTKARETIQEQTNQIKDTIQGQVLKKIDDDQVHRCIVRFCRLWKHRRPKSFIDSSDEGGGFAIYRSFNSDAGNFSRSLLVGIPSPRRGSTKWPFVEKRARFPVVLTWENGWSKPPLCRFPENCGSFSGLSWEGDVYNYRVRDAWYPDMSILNVLLMLQNLVGHVDNESALAELATEYPITADLLTVLGKFEPSVDGGGENDDYDWRQVGDDPPEIKSCFAAFLPFKQTSSNDMAEFIEMEWA